MTVTRRNHGKGHSYTLAATGEKLTGVTTHLRNGVPKPQLQKWAVESTLNYLMDHWDELVAMPMSERISTLRKARYEDVSRAASKGTKIHRLAEKLIAGERVAIPEGLDGYIEAYVRFLDGFDVEAQLVEATVFHRRSKLVGCFDVLGTAVDPEDDEPDMTLRRRESWLYDIKSSRSGIFGETALQLAGYRWADCWIDEHGVEHDLPQIDRAGAVWLRPNGEFEFIELDVPEERLRDLQYVQQVARIVDEMWTWVGEPIEPPRVSSFRLVAEAMAEVTG